jgi:hypothetical protein
MRPCVVLVDYENVQPTEFVEVAQAGCHVWFFVGSSQKRVSTDLPDFIARFPAQSRFIRMEKPGKNSLDFHICYYLGVAAHERPEWLYVLMSKDTGYDPLLAHVRNEGMFAQRVVTIPQLHALLGIGSASRAEVGEVAPKAAPRRAPRATAAVSAETKAAFAPKPAPAAAPKPTPLPAAKPAAAPKPAPAPAPKPAPAPAPKPAPGAAPAPKPAPAPAAPAPKPAPAPAAPAPKPASAPAAPAPKPASAPAAPAPAPTASVGGGGRPGFFQGLRGRLPGPGRP